MPCDGTGTLGCPGCPECRREQHTPPARTFPISWWGNQPLPPNWGQLPDPKQEF